MFKIYANYPMLKESKYVSKYNQREICILLKTGIPCRNRAHKRYYNQFLLHINFMQVLREFQQMQEVTEEDIEEYLGRARFMLMKLMDEKNEEKLEEVNKIWHKIVFHMHCFHLA